MDVTFVIKEAPRVYVERIDVNGNTLTQDKVVRREFRLAEGDAFNSLQVKRSTNRIKSLGLLPGELRGRAEAEAARPTASCSKPTSRNRRPASSSFRPASRRLESFIFQASIQQRNFRGRGQTVGLVGQLFAAIPRAARLSFTEPYVFDQQHLGRASTSTAAIYNSFNYLNNDRNTTYQQSTTGFQAARRACR